MKFKNGVIIGLVIFGLIGLVVYVKWNTKKIIYVKVDTLYADFEMKKELENTYITVQKGRKNQLDSLELELKLMNKQINIEGEKKELVSVFEARREAYLLKKQQFEQDDALMQEQFTTKIRKQLNQYVTDYGKENNCDYILGAEGSGALMYAKDNDDVTKEVLVYINNKYKGVK
jgi:outer membrane protein